MRTSLRPLVIAIVPLALLGAACSSDDDSDTPTDTEASSDAPAGTEAAGDTPAATDAADEESSGGNPEVEAFCDEVDEFVAGMEEVLADPTSGDAAELATLGQELSASAAELAGSVDASDSARLQECTANLSEIGS